MRILLFLTLLFMMNGIRSGVAQNPVTGRKIKTVTEYNTDNKKKELDHVTKYNEEGLKTDETEYFSDGKAKSRTVYEYDREKRCIKETKYGQKAKVERISVYEYDAEGNKIRATIVDSEKRQNQHKVFEYTYY